MSTKTYLLINRHSGKALQSENAENGALVTQTEITYEKSQLWVQTGKKECTKFINAQTGKVLDLVFAGTQNGTYAHTWEEISDSQSQNWAVTNASRGFRKITNINSNKVLDIVDFSTENGGIAQIWGDENSTSQEWKIEEYPAIKKKTSTKKIVPNTKDKMKK